MTFPADFPDLQQSTDQHIVKARRFWTPTEDSHAVPASQSTPGGHPGDAAISDASPSLADLRDARKRLRRLGVAVARPAAVAARPRQRHVPPIPAVTPSFVSYAAERVSDGPWGPSWWVVSNVVTGVEVARYATVGLDGPGAILRYLQEEQCWQERRQGGGAA